jgi:RNA polymerase sigma-70 factor, ECF subfamily
VSAATCVNDDSDENLIRESALGEDRAFARLLERYRARVAQLVRWHLGPHSLWAEDVAQDVFVQVHRNAGSFQGRSSFKTWLYSVALNVCRDHARREGAGARRRHTNDDSEDFVAAIPDGSLDPLERLERDEREALVRSAVERLAPTHRTVLQLRDWEGLSYEEIAEIVGVPIGTVRSRLHNARATLAKGLLESLRR